MEVDLVENVIEMEESITNCDNSIVDDKEVMEENKEETKETKVCDSAEMNEFSYIKQGYTTEIFKVEIRNLPKRVEYSAFINFLRSKKITYRKVKVLQANKFKSEVFSHAYITLSSAEERAKAIELLNNLKWKGNDLEAKESEPVPDPLIQKRQDRRDFRDSSDRSKVGLDENFDCLPEEDREAIINNQVASLWKTPYEEQLKQKLSLLQRALKKCLYESLKIFNHLPKDSESREQVNPIIEWFAKVRLDSPTPSPVLDGYRNKCEFNVDSNNSVGFRLGLYKEGSIKVVAPPKNCPIISEQMHQVLSNFQDFLTTKSSLKGFNPITHEGHWRQLLVRTTRSKSCLICVAIHRQELTDQQLEDEFNQFKSHFANKSCGVSSIYAQVINDRSSQVGKSIPKLIDGDSHVYEKLMKDTLEIRISPLSFFQINTEAAEILYSKIVELANCSADKSTVLDICCGTGTIGLCLARSAKKVIGIELNEDAIKDARFNAEHNKITNVEFYCGRAETTIGQVLSKLGPDEEDVVAIIDPPRSGLVVSLIKSVRNNPKIKRIVYVSCEAMAARQNFIDLCRPQSKAYFGVPFIPRIAIPVDMFPHTDRCELIILFERVE